MKTTKSTLKQWLFENSLLLATLLGVSIGGIIGFGVRPLSLSPSSILLISYPGELFMRLLKLLILPLIISSLVAGSASINAKLNGRIAVRTLLYFLCTSVFNAILGVVLVTAIHPGNAGLKEALGSGTETREASSMLDSMLDLGRNLVSENIFQATFQQAHTAYVNTTIQKLDDLTTQTILVREVRYRNGINTLGLVFFCLIFGTILGTLGEKSKAVVNIFTVIFEVIMKFVSGVMWLTPFGICSVIAGKILSVYDLGLVMSNLAWFIATVVSGVFIYQLIVLQLVYFTVVRRNPFAFYVGLSQGTLTAFATASTAAALPITFRLMDDKLRVDARITRFVLPIGCNINTDGTAMFIAIAAIFIAQMNGIALSLGELVTVVCTSTAASLSVASVPSAALVLLLMVLSSIDTPVQDVSLLFAVDWIVDRFRTTNNMLGDCYAAAIVEVLSKKELMAADAIQESLTSANDTALTFTMEDDEVTEYNGRIV